MAAGGPRAHFAGGKHALTLTYVLHQPPALDRELHSILL